MPRVGYVGATETRSVAGGLGCRTCCAGYRTTWVKDCECSCWSTFVSPLEIVSLIDFGVESLENALVPFVHYYVISGRILHLSSFISHTLFP